MRQLALVQRVQRDQCEQARDFEFPLPPLPEQQRIVGILDEAFEGIATAKANAEKNLQNARALFESHLQSVFTQRGKGWVEKTTWRDVASIRSMASQASTSEMQTAFRIYRDNDMSDWRHSQSSD